MYDRVEGGFTHGAPSRCHLYRLDDTPEAEGVEAGINERLVLVVLQTNGTPLFSRSGTSCRLYLILWTRFSHCFEQTPLEVQLVESGNVSW